MQSGSSLGMLASRKMLPWSGYSLTYITFLNSLVLL